jgi:hypothetical protein
VCVAVRPVPAGVPSPQFQECAVTVPSLSAEADPSTATPSPLVVAVNDAVGRTFAGASGPPAATEVTAKLRNRTAVAVVTLVGR